MSKVTGRGGPHGRRYTWTKWVITERDPSTGALLAPVTTESEPSTIAAAHRVIAKFVGKE